ncbi:MAG: BrnT family toxin [Chloroflexota bacterium]
MYQFWWDEDNIEHIANHGVEPYEAEEVIDDSPLILRAGKDRYAAYGQADSGRYLIVVFAIKPDERIRVITARDLTAAEKKRLRRRRK